MLNIAKHRTILIKILKDIFTDSTIGPVLGFKGGTAAALFYNLDRFSVDLDFDLLDTTKENLVFERIKLILEKYGVLKEASQKIFNLIYILSYNDKDINAQNIKVEINRREFGSQYDVQSFLGISMKVMVKEDMAAHKLVAMYERIGKTNRDIYDAYFFLHHDWPINKQIIKERTGMSLKDFLQKCISLVEKVDNTDILAGMGELLDEKQKVWAKKNLINDTLFLLKLRFNQEILENT